ncbi:MAG: outer membrane beta-barrel protein [Thiobacillaceae bacterium]
MKKELTLLAAIFAGFPAVVLADPPAPEAPKPAIPSLGDVLGASNITLTGYVDATYSYFDKNPYPNGIYGGTWEPARQFDYRENSFALSQAALTASYLPTSGFGALVNMIAGSDGRVLRDSELSNGNTTASDFDVYQAFVQYVGGPATLMAGKFATLAGAETVNPTTDTTISRSLLFTAMEPLSHTGVRAAYAPNSMFTITAGANNGWNYTSAPTANGSTISGKTGELGITVNPSKMFSLSGTVYSGQAPSADGTGVKTLYDVVATINATDALSFVVNGDYLTQDNNGVNGASTTADGVAGYVNYAINGQWSVTLRGEYIDDKDGALSGTTPMSNTLKEASLDLNYTPTKNTMFLAEVRQDNSDKKLFDFNVNTGNPSATYQDSFELEAIYKF